MNTYGKTFSIKRKGEKELLFQLDRPGDFSEDEVEGILLSIIYETSPELDSESGKLLPGSRAKDIPLSIHLSENEEPIHIEGIICPESLKEALVSVIQRHGFNIEQNAV